MAKARPPDWRLVVATASATGLDRPTEAGARVVAPGVLGGVVAEGEVAGGVAVEGVAGAGVLAAGACAAAAGVVAVAAPSSLSPPHPATARAARQAAAMLNVEKCFGDMPPNLPRNDNRTHKCP